MTMSSEAVVRLILKYEQAKTLRQTRENLWQELAEYIQPGESNITTRRVMEGQKKMEKVYDSTAIDASEVLAASLHGMLIGYDKKWFKIESIDDELNEDEENIEWFNDTTDRMLAAIHDPRAQFSLSLDESFLNLATFGVSPFSVFESDETGEYPFYFDSWGVREIYIAENAYGRVDTIYRLFEMTAAQIVEKFDTRGDIVHEDIRKMAADKPQEKIDILHCIMPRGDYREGLIVPAKYKRYGSYHIDMKHKQLMRESGADELPVMVGRWRVKTGELYGEGPGEMALPDIRMLNEMEKANISAAEIMLNPPLDVPPNTYPKGIKMYAGAMNYRSKALAGDDRVRPIIDSVQLPIALDVAEQKRQAIRSRFYNDVLQLAEAPDMTAYEVAQRLNQKLRLMAPMLGRVQSELLSPAIERVFGIMMRLGLLEEPPEALEGKEIKIRYLSQLSQAQEASEVDAIINTMNVIAPLGQVFGPEIYDNFDGDRVTRNVAHVYGVDPDNMRELDVMQAMREQRNSQMEQAQQAQDAMTSARAVKDFASAEAMRAG